MQNQPASTIVYRFKNGLYINLTNRCPNLCVFCIKTKWNMRFDGHNLNLQGQEPSAEQTLSLVEQELQKAPAAEVVFCGYGESTMRLDVLREVAQGIKERWPKLKIRLNTNGMGNLINGRNIVPLLAKHIDEVYVSLNAQDAQTWRRIVCPKTGFEDGFDGVTEFITLCAGAGFKKVVASCVDRTGADPAKVKELAERCGAEFYLRSYLDAEN